MSIEAIGMASPTRRGTTTTKSPPKTPKRVGSRAVTSKQPVTGQYGEVTFHGKKIGKIAEKVAGAFRSGEFRTSTERAGGTIHEGRRKGVLADDSYEIPYVTIASRSPSENSDAVRRGIKAAFIKQLATDLEIDQSTLTDHMGIARSTFTRKLKNDEPLSSGDGAIALGVARIIGEVDRVLLESGDPGQMGTSFHVAEWTGNWLKQPAGALGNRRPLDYLDNAFGQETVLQLIRQMQTGAFA